MQVITLFTAWNHKPANIQLFPFHRLKPSSCLVTLLISDTIEMCFCFHLAIKCLAVEMQYDVKMLFIFFLFNYCKQCKSASSKCVSHQLLTFCIWWTVVLTLHSLNGWNRGDTHHEMFAMLSSMTWKKKEEVQYKNKSGLNIPTEVNPPPELFVLREGNWVEVDLMWWPLSIVFWRPGPDNFQMERHHFQM